MDDFALPKEEKASLSNSTNDQSLQKEDLIEYGHRK
jgi:hypothetical protein